VAVSPATTADKWQAIIWDAPGSTKKKQQNMNDLN